MNTVCLRQLRRQDGGQFIFCPQEALKSQKSALVDRLTAIARQQQYYLQEQMGMAARKTGARAELRLTRAFSFISPAYKFSFSCCFE